MQRESVANFLEAGCASVNDENRNSGSIFMEIADMVMLRF